MNEDLIWAIKKTLLEQLDENSVFMESDDYEIRKHWIVHEATERQLLGLVLLQEDENILKKTHKYAQTAYKQTHKYFNKANLKARTAYAQRGVAQAQNASSLGGMANNAMKFFQSPEGKKVLMTGGLAIAGVVGLGVAANYLYKRFFSAAAKACKGKSGDEYKQCVAQFKSGAVKKTIQKLKTDRAACAKSKNPQVCTAKIDKEIAKWQKKAV